jgi:HKD family nuclease
MKSLNPSKFEIIENTGPNNVFDTLKLLLRKASQVDIAVAFVSAPGLNELLPTLHQVAARGTVRILTGLYQSITDPLALRALLRAQTQTRGQLSTHISKDPKFHRKMYLARDRNIIRAIVGSSNLTRDGLRSGGEMNVYLSSPANSASMCRLAETFDISWEHRSVPLEVGIIDRYVRLGHFHKQKESKHNLPLRKIIGASSLAGLSGGGKPDGTVTFWRDTIQGYVSKQTEAVIASTTNWDDRGYFWYSSGPHKYKQKDRILMFDLTVNKVQVVQVVAWTRTAVRTPDGVHFVAFKYVRGLKARKLNGPKWGELKLVLGMTGKRDIHFRRKIAQGKWSDIVTMFR